MMIKDSYLLAASHSFELKDMEEVTADIELTKVPLCYHTLLTGRVLHKNCPIKNAVVKVFDCKYNPLFHTVTNGKGVYRFENLLEPGIYKVVAAAEGYQVSKTFNVRIKEKEVIKKSFDLKKCSIFNNGIIYGKIKEEGSRKPIEGASIYLKDGCSVVFKTTSNKDGQYIIYNIRPKKYELTVVKHGYTTTKPLEVIVEKKDRIMLCFDLIKHCKRYNKTISGVVTNCGNPVPCVVVFLYQLGKDGSETLIKSQVTNEEGAYLFSDLEKGCYIIKGKIQFGNVWEKQVDLLACDTEKERKE